MVWLVFSEVVNISGARLFFFFAGKYKRSEDDWMEGTWRSQEEHGRGSAGVRGELAVTQHHINLCWLGGKWVLQKVRSEKCVCVCCRTCMNALRFTFDCLCSETEIRVSKAIQEYHATVSSALVSFFSVPTHTFRHASEYLSRTLLPHGVVCHPGDSVKGTDDKSKGKS